MTWKKFWSIIDRVRAKADMQDEASVKQFLYTELINLPQDELLGFDCAWQSYRNQANFPKMVAAACIINDGSSDDRFTDFRNWLIMQGYNEFYTQNMPDKVAWKTLQSDLFANLPQIKAERMPQDFSVVLPKLWRKRQAWDAERTKRPPYRGEER